MFSSTYIEIIFSILAFFISLAITKIMIKINIQDVPEERSSHNQVTPRGGGASIMGAIFFVFFLLYFIKDILFITKISLIISLLFFVLGLVDDIMKLSWVLRLSFEVIFSIILIIFGFAFNTIAFPFIGDINLPFLLSVTISVLWIIGFVNTLNFMDGLNGLVSGCSLISSFFIILFLGINEDFSLLFVILFFSLIGFFIFNFPKGKIFLGDSGSLFLGAIFAVIPLLLTNKISFFVLPILFFSFLYDTTFTLIRRSLKGRDIFSSHRDHLYQILNRSGWTHKQVSLLQFSFFVSQGLGILFIKYIHEVFHVFMFIPFFIIQITYTIVVLLYGKKKGVIL